ncbi:MAG: ANTAR domain-containing protein [Acidimicrobiales bacterium]
MVEAGETATEEEELAASLSAEVSNVALTLFAAGSVVDTLGEVVRLAVDTVEGCDYAGIFVVEGGVITTPVRTGDVVGEVDALQHRAGEGPCLDAITHGIPAYAEDLVDDPRWPAFAPQAAAHGMRSLLALPLSSKGIGALNLYASYPSAFGVIDRGRGILLASLAGIALTSARSHEDEERQTEHLRAALETRELIGQAQGILMERERITANQAFDILRRASQHLNRKLREVAQDLVETGERPDTGNGGTAAPT